MSQMVTLSRRKALFAGGASALVAVPAMAQHRAGPAKGRLEDSLPEAQQRFAAAIDRAWLQSQSETSSERRLELLYQRGEALKAALSGSVAFSEWVCVLRSVATAKGFAIITMRVLGTKSDGSAMISNLSVTGGSDMRLPDDSPLARFALSLPVRSPVMASGDFRADPRQGFANVMESNDANDAKMEFEVPAFSVRYTDIAQPPWLKEFQEEAR